MIKATAAWILGNDNTRAYEHLGPAALKNSNASAAIALPRRWAVPVFAGAITVFTYHVVYWQKIEEINGVKIDTNSVADLHAFSRIPTESFRVDREFEKKPGTFHLAGVDDVRTGIFVGERRRCLLYGRFLMSNFDTSLEIALVHRRPLTTREQKLDWLVNDSSLEDGQYVGHSMQSEIWNWASDKGKEVEFRRVFRNESSTRQEIVFRVWHGSSKPALVSGDFHVQCTIT